jgi:hypothetical protein
MNARAGRQRTVDDHVANARNDRIVEIVPDDGLSLARIVGGIDLSRIKRPEIHV